MVQKQSCPQRLVPRDGKADCYLALPRSQIHEQTECRCAGLLRQGRLVMHDAPSEPGQISDLCPRPHPEGSWGPAQASWV